MKLIDIFNKREYKCSHCCKTDGMFECLAEETASAQHATTDEPCSMEDEKICRLARRCQ